MGYVGGGSIRRSAESMQNQWLRRWAYPAKCLAVLLPGLYILSSCWSQLCLLSLQQSNSWVYIINSSLLLSKFLVFNPTTDQHPHLDDVMVAVMNRFWKQSNQLWVSWLKKKGKQSKLPVRFIVTCLCKYVNFISSEYWNALCTS